MYMYYIQMVSVSKSKKSSCIAIQLDFLHLETDIIRSLLLYFYPSRYVIGPNCCQWWNYSLKMTEKKTRSGSYSSRVPYSTLPFSYQFYLASKTFETKGLLIELSAVAKKTSDGEKSFLKLYLRFGRALPIEA